MVYSKMVNMVFFPMSSDLNEIVKSTTSRDNINFKGVPPYQLIQDGFPKSIRVYSETYLSTFTSIPVG